MEREVFGFLAAASRKDRPSFGGQAGNLTYLHWEHRQVTRPRKARSQDLTER